MSSVKRKSEDKATERKGVRNRSRKFYPTFVLQNLQIKLQKRYQKIDIYIYQLLRTGYKLLLKCGL